MEVTSPGPAVRQASAPPRSVTADPALAQRVQSLRLPTQKSAGGSSGWVGWLLALVFAGTTGWLLFNPIAPVATVEPKEEAASKSPEASGASTAVATARPKDTGAASTAVLTLESKGYIIPEQQILVSPQVSGRVIELNFDAGYRVEKGAVLAVLDSTEYRADLERAIATVAAARARYVELDVGSRPDEIVQARAELDEAQTNFEQAERDYLRTKDLRRQSIATVQEFEQAESTYRANMKKVARLEAGLRLMEEGPREEKVRAAEAELNQAEAECKRAQWRLDNTIIQAPISGTILKKNAELGNLVNPVAFNGSFSLCDVADLSRLEVELTIQERDISKVFAGQRCKLRAEAFPKRIYEGVVSRLMPIADRAKGAIPVRVRIEVPPGENGQYLKPEMGAIVQFFGTAEPVEDIVPAADTPASALTPTNRLAGPIRQL